MPVHQVTMEHGVLKEVYVALDGDRLITQAGEPSTPLLEQRLNDLGVQLAEGQVAEINLAMDGWMADAGHSLERGFILTVDYGRTAGDLYSAKHRNRGTLTTYRQHLQTDRPQERIGQQDISAQVDFTSLQRAGERAGLDYLGYTTQAEFLHNLGLGALLRRPFADSARQTQANRVGMTELAKPGGLGDFKVMAMGKGVGQPDLWGFVGSDDAVRLTSSLPQPAMTPDHIDLMAGRYPAAQVELELSWEDLWPNDPPGANADVDEVQTG